MDVVLLIVRIGAGILFARHGAQKLFGWFGGQGVSGTAAVFESLRLWPGRHQVIAAGVSEVTAGTLLALGLITPLATMLVVSTMTAAFITVNARKPWDNDSDLNVLYVLVAFAVTGIGAGAISVDDALGVEVAGIGWAAAAAAVGAVGGTSAVVVGRIGSRRRDRSSSLDGSQA